MVGWTNATGTTVFSGYVGFTYCINYTDGSVYYGKKNFISTTRRKLGKKELAKRTDKRTSCYKQVSKESDWRTYGGSSKRAIGKCIQQKTILKLFKTKGALTFGEVELLCKERVLHRADCINDNISGKFYTKNIGAKPWTWKKDKHK